MLCLSGGCGQGGLSSSGPQQASLQAWTANEMAAITDRVPASRDGLLLDSSDRVSLIAAGNETVSFQVVVDSQATAVSQLRLLGSKLTGPSGDIAPANIKFFRMLPVKVSEFPAWYLRLIKTPPGPANFYDALAPAEAPSGGQPYELPPGQRLAFWVDITTDRSTPPGQYAGSITLSSASHQAFTIPIVLRVYGFVLPDARHIPAIGGFDHQAVFRAFLARDGKPFEPPRMDRTHPLVRQGLGIIRQMMVLAHEHRLDLFERTLRPTLRREMSGRAVLDWEDYDNVVMPYLSGSAFEDRVGCAAWPSPFSQDWPDASNYGGLGSDAYASLAGDVIKQCSEHFQAAGAEQIFTWPYRREISADAFQTHSALARLVRSHDGQTSILAQLPPQAPADAHWPLPQDFTSLADIIAPPAAWLDPAWSAQFARPDSKLKGVWLCPGTPPCMPGLSVIASPADARAIPWFAARYGCTGIFMDETLNWAGDVFNSPAGAETRLFYPGKIVGIDGVLPSVRLKRLRRGLQDVSYLWILKQRQKQAIAESIATSLVRYGGLAAAGDNYQDIRLDGWVQEASAWQLAHRLLAEEVNAAVNGEQTGAESLLAQRVAWQEFDEKTHSLRVEQARCVVRPADNAGGLRATVLLDVFNEFSQPTDVLAKLESLPPGWKATKAEENIAAMLPGEARTITLEAEGSHIPSSADGKMSLPVSITANMQRRQELSVAATLLLAARTQRAPVIDGLLDDWGMHAGNSAGNFKLVGRRGSDGDATCKETLALVMHDETNLYLAFRCSEPNPSGVVARPTNIIRYEQLLACGEDLVEVILDPGAKAKRPEDLYHIVIKANGVLLAEKGVQTEPPLGNAQPWPVAAQVAVMPGDSSRKFWTVELAIPLAAFGQDAKASLWGVNFTRFATQGSEASSWSAAPRYFYDPKNLGTMLIVRNDE